MTGPYQPPGGDINSPFGPSDPTSPFSTPPNGESKDTPNDDEEPSPYQGVQYELETPGGQPQHQTPPPQQSPASFPTPPPPSMGQGQYAPQPTFAPLPPKKSSNGGLIIGGVIAGVVVVLLLVGIVVVAVASAISEEGGGGTSGGESDQADATYTVPGAPCDDVDLSSVTEIGEFANSPTGSSSAGSSYGYASCSGSTGDFQQDDYSYFSMTVNSFSDAERAESGYKAATGSSTTKLDGCDVSDAKGSWAQGKLGTGSSCSNPTFGDSKVVLTIQDDNLTATIYIDCKSSQSSKAEDAVKSVAESLLTESKK